MVFETSGWKECPDDVNYEMKYYIDEDNPRIATKSINNGVFCTIIGNTPLPLNKVTSWSIKILESEEDAGRGIYIGVAPFDIDQAVKNNFNCNGWYFNCYKSALCSGPPHNYRDKTYGSQNPIWGCIRKGDSVGVVMDMTKGELSFVLNGVNLGVAYEGIPLDKPLVPCVILGNEGDSVELDTSEVKENKVDSSIPIPSNTTSKSNAWDSITLSWDKVEGAEFYLIEMDGSKMLHKSTANEYTKTGLLPDIEHSFRVRAVKDNSLSKWSDIIKGNTVRAQAFSECVWKECPDDVQRKYSVDENNLRIATSIGNNYCTIIGNTPLPPNKVTSWNIKILKSRNNDGKGIYVGVAPSNINQNKTDNSNTCGWYFHCHGLKLCSGPPHNYEGKEYGAMKWSRKYVHTGDSVRAMMDTIKGELSFVLNGMNLGIAYEGIPLDKPLVPCVLLKNQEDSIELITSGIRESSVSEWNDDAEGKAFKSSGWKECPGHVDWNRKYSVDEDNPRIATSIGDEYSDCTVIGNTYLPLNKVTSWNIKILKSKKNNGGGIYIGITPFDINQNEDCNYNKSGWYFKCYTSELRSGPPHKYSGKEYGPRKENGEYVHTRDTVGVIMDTTKSELSFVVNRVNYGVGYEGIPLDKPLVLCVILEFKGDSVELITSSEVKEIVDSSIPVPSNITTKSETWDSITLTWNKVKRAYFYQVEVDENKKWYTSTTNKFTKRGLLPETEHTFRVRTMKDNVLSIWSDVIKGRTMKAHCFSECIWKKCLDDSGYKKYSVSWNNLRIASSNCCCTIIGNTPLPLNKVTSWSIKILKSMDNDGNYIYIGVAPFDIDQAENKNYEKCGWYFNCYESTLRSGPPHNYYGKEYGPIKDEWNGKYFHTGDSVGVVMDTSKKELSFVLNGMDYGIAYKGIPLDKPLVPCVILKNEGDSVELIT